MNKQLSRSGRILSMLPWFLLAASASGADIGIVNGDFSADADNTAPPTGWTDLTPTSFWVGFVGDTTGTPAAAAFTALNSAEGTAFSGNIMNTARLSAGAGSQPNPGAVVQTVDLSAFATQIDNGSQLFVDFDWGSGDFNDTGVFSLSFFGTTDGSGAALGSGFSVNLDEADNFNFVGGHESVGGAVPVGTRSVTLRIDITRAAGSQTDLVFDNFAGEILADSDSDGLPDDWETLYGLNPNEDGTVDESSPGAKDGPNGAGGDPDSDGLTNLEEYQDSETNPTVADSDSDGLDDGPEVNGTLNDQVTFTGYDPTDPNDDDSDDDGIDDGDEVTGDLNVDFFFESTDPNDADSDDDGFTDNQEITGSENPVGPNEPTDPNFADTDFDGWDDAAEILYYGTDANDEVSVPSVHELIGLVKRNGSFEYRDGVLSNTTAFKQGWDGASDIDSWTTWTEWTSTSTDSGAEYDPAEATDGNMLGFCQNGNGAKNMTSYLAKEGDIIRLTYDRVNGYPDAGDTFLVFDGTNNSLGFLPIPASPAQENTSNGSFTLTYVIPPGSLAIGRPIGVGIRNNTGSASWPGWDRVILTVQDQDSDNDGLSDFWEDRWFGDNDDQPEPAELTVATGNGNGGGSTNNDGDAYDNLAEQAGDSNPTDPGSIPADSDADGLDDLWEDEFFGDNSGTVEPSDLTPQDGSGDPDHDFCTNEVEETAGTFPDDATDWPDADGDNLNDGWEERFATGSNKDGVIDAGELDLLKGDASQTGLPGSANPDGDLFNNEEEMIAGSDPEDAAWTPAMPKLAHRWSLNAGDLTDLVGSSDAQILNDDVGNTGNTSNLGANGVTLDGGAKATSDYISLGTNLLQGKETPVTIELWATPHGVQNWSRIFSFGSGESENLFMSWTQGTTANSDRVGWNDASSLNGDNTNAPYTLDTQYHIVMTLIPAVNTINDDVPLFEGTRVVWHSAPVGDPVGAYYARGTFDSANTLSDFNDLACNLGRSFYGDNTANATYDEVRIYDGALTGAGVQTNGFADTAGPDDVNPLEDTDDDGLYDAWENHYFVGGIGGQDGSSTTGDADGVNLADEQAGGSDPTVTASVPGDLDGDGLDDVDFEFFYFDDLSQGANDDPDGDFDVNSVEQTNLTDPTLKSSFFSSTADTVPDSWKTFYGIGAQTGADDLDEGTGDGLTNTQEFDLGTDPTDKDSDDDGLDDGPEVNATLNDQATPTGFAATDPFDPDSDDDGLDDGPEVNATLNDQSTPTGFAATDPNDADSDTDGFSDAIEVANGSDPNDAGSGLGVVLPIVNGGFETPVIAQPTVGLAVSGGTVPGWTAVVNDLWVIQDDTGRTTDSASEGLQFVTSDRRAPEPDLAAGSLVGGDAATMSIRQDVDVSSLSTEIDAGARTLSLSFDWTDGDTEDDGVVSVRFLDGSGVDLGHSAQAVSGGASGWNTSSFLSFPPVGTRTVRITAEVIRSGAGTARNVAFDHFRGRLYLLDDDSDGLPDEWEELYEVTDAAGHDDADTLTNLQEYQNGTDPTLADTDGDGFNDDVEVNAGSDPLDPASLPSLADPAIDSTVVTTDGSGQVTQVQVTASGLDTSKTYALKRGTDLSSFPDTVDSKQPASDTEVFTDSSPLPKATSGKAFYRLEEQ